MGKHWRVAALCVVLAAAVLVSGCAPTAPKAAALDVRALAAQTSAFQAAILKDGKVSAAEYESAALAHRACVEDAGGVVGELTAVGDNELGFTFTIEAATEEAARAMEREAEGCLGEYFDIVGRVWAYQQLISPEQRDALRPEVATCLRSVGIDLPDSFTSTQLTDHLSAHEGAVGDIKPCMEKYPEFFAVNPAEAGAADRHAHGDG